MSPRAPQTVSGCLRLSNWRAILTTQADTLSNKRCLLTLVLTPEDLRRCLSPGNWFVRVSSGREGGGGGGVGGAERGDKLIL